MKVLLKEKQSVFRVPVKETILPGAFDDYYHGEDQIEEEKLLKELPAGFLPLPAENVAIQVENKMNEAAGRVLGTRGQRNLKIFEDYDKYTCRFTLLLCRYE